MSAATPSTPSAEKALPVAEPRGSDEISLQKADLLGQEHVDPVLSAKMHLVNNAIDEIGMTPYQWRLFVLNGFGYAVDSQILLVQSIIATSAANEFAPSFPYGMTIAVYVGMLVGALFWGLSADIIGRKWSIFVWCLVFHVGNIVQMASPRHHWYEVMMGRWVVGLAVGSLSLMVPMYMAETAPYHTRGAMIRYV